MSQVQIEKEKDITNIVILYSDGTKEEIQKGFVAQVVQEEDETTMKMKFVNTSGPELMDMAYAVCVGMAQFIPPHMLEEEEE
ncbi:hypothetical protein ACFYKX_10485 [Cytobacillus sp. FJAT-54145]|uniref:Uncharacterized protein n=1 Tax=Cytobacillus spartinae TaxID=3299023 RepID=A0ABW6KDR9_9BACI